jgi:hypothetical protein
MRWHWGTLVASLTLSLAVSPAWGSDALPIGRNKSPAESPTISDYKNLDPILNQNPGEPSSNGCPASGLVGFSVVGTDHVSSGGPTLLGYSGIYESVGGGWTPGGGTFIAPCPGLYS